MSSPFLVRFAHRVLERLIAESLVELEPNTEVRIVDFLANWLASGTEGSQLLSSLERGLLTCPDIHELYADRDTLKVIVEGLGADMSDPFQPIPLFAFPLFSTMFGDAPAHKQGLVDLITAHRARSGGLRRSNRDGWHSGEEFLREKDEHLAWVLHNATVYAERALGRYHGGWARHTLQLGGFWANALDGGGWNAPHHHLPQTWSGVYYVSVPDVGTTPDELHGRIEFLNPNLNQSAFGGGSFAYAPKDGLTLLFPASLTHMVHPTRVGTEPRLSLAWNFNVVPK